MLPRFQHIFTQLKFVGLPFVLAGWMLGNLPTQDGA